MNCSRCNMIYDIDYKSDGSIYKTCKICREYLNDRYLSIKIIKQYIKTSRDNDKMIRNYLLKNNHIIYQ